MSGVKVRFKITCIKIRIDKRKKKKERNNCNALVI